MTKHFRLLLLFLLAACSSTHDLKRDGFNTFGGGFIDDQVGPGLYRIKAFSNTSPLATPDSAAKTFRYRAEQLFPAGYEEVRTVTDAYKSSTGGTTIIDPKRSGISIEGPAPVITSKIGHIRCSDSPLSPYEAKALVTPQGEQ